MAKFRIKDKHRAMINDVAAGKIMSQAYRDHISIMDNPGKMSVAVACSRLMRRPQMQALLKEATAARSTEIINVVARKVAQEFSTPLLTVDEMDNYHSAIIQGLIMVEEVVPVWQSVYNKQGNLIRREQSFKRVSRPPNVREKQISIDALYKRFGNYAPSRLFAGFGKVADDAESEQAERVILLSDGTKIPLFGKTNEIKQLKG